MLILIPVFNYNFYSGESATGRPSSTTRALCSRAVRLLISRTGGSDANRLYDLLWFTHASLHLRFRTYFPDAYRLHYPNAKTHLSSRVRSTLPDGTSIFEKTRSKKRRPFSKEEDEALRRGYEQVRSLLHW
jgi:hypothetical protein